MVFVAEAFTGWLFGQLADAGRRRLGEWMLGSNQQRALQQAATAAIHATACQLRPEPGSVDDAQGADHLARVIDQVFQHGPTPDESLANHATLLQGLQAGVALRLTVLEDADITEAGQSSAELLDVSVPALADLLTGQLLREIITRGASGGPLTPLASQLNHDVTHLQDQQHGAGLARLTKDLHAALATLNRLDQQARPVPAKTTPPLGRPVPELTDPFALEVHRAIDAPDTPASLPELPVYVERDHDRQLHAVVKQAAEGRSVAAVLVGGSSTGKTRACWEAVQSLPHDWRLWHPIDPSRPEAAADALPAVGRRTVIWLNEAQHYLLTPASGLGERVAAGLRELLRDPEREPVLLLGTIWPEYWATLTTPPAPDQQDDPHAQARALLTGIDITVPDAFTGPGLRAVQAAARVDPRLARAAVGAEDGRITQFLAGGPALLERYRNAPAAAKAMIEAAMDARRLGHGLYLPHGLLEAAASGYLTDQQWDALGEDWLEQALAYCAAPCRGARGPLTRVRPRPGQAAPTQPRYRLADYLEQTGRAERRIFLAPAALWDAFVEHADERDLLWIADAARGRSLYDHAFRLYRRAAEAGDLDALRPAARLLEGAGRLDEAIGLYRRAAEAGDLDALRPAAQLLEGAGRLDEAVAWYRRAVEAGDLDALREAAELLERVGGLDEAVGWYRRAVEAGDPHALWLMVEPLEEAGRLDEVMDWLQARAAEATEPLVLQRVAESLGEAGRLDEAIGLYQRAFEAGDPSALRRVASLLEEAGRLDEAIAWYQRAAEAGNSEALSEAAELLEQAGRRDEAAQLRQYGLEPGSHIASEWH
jgi:TPR repeat protein